MQSWRNCIGKDTMYWCQEEKKSLAITVDLHSILVTISGVLEPNYTDSEESFINLHEICGLVVNYNNTHTHSTNGQHVLCAILTLLFKLMIYLEYYSNISRIFLLQEYCIFFSFKMIQFCFHYDGPWCRLFYFYFTVFYFELWYIS